MSFFFGKPAVEHPPALDSFPYRGQYDIVRGTTNNITADEFKDGEKIAIITSPNGKIFIFQHTALKRMWEEAGFPYNPMVGKGERLTGTSNVKIYTVKLVVAPKGGTRRLSRAGRRRTRKA